MKHATICLNQEVCDPDTNALVPLTEILIHNKEKRDKFMSVRIEKGYSFKYIKGFVNNKRINVGVECNETSEQFAFEWGRRVPQEERLTEIMGDDFDKPVFAGFDKASEDPDILGIGDGTESIYVDDPNSDSYDSVS